MPTPITIYAEARPVSEETIKNYYQVKDLPHNQDLPNWDLEDEIGWDF